MKRLSILKLSAVALGLSIPIFSAPEKFSFPEPTERSKIAETLFSIQLNYDAPHTPDTGEEIIASSLNKNIKAPIETITPQFLRENALIILLKENSTGDSKLALINSISIKETHTILTTLSLPELSAEIQIEPAPRSNYLTKSTILVKDTSGIKRDLREINTPPPNGNAQLLTAINHKGEKYRLYLMVDLTKESGNP